MATGTLSDKLITGTSGARSSLGDQVVFARVLGFINHCNCTGFGVRVKKREARPQRRQEVLHHLSGRTDRDSRLTGHFELRGKQVSKRGMGEFVPAVSSCGVSCRIGFRRLSPFNFGSTLKFNWRFLQLTLLRACLSVVIPCAASHDHKYGYLLADPPSDKDLVDGYLSDRVPEFVAIAADGHSRACLLVVIPCRMHAQASHDHKDGYLLADPPSDEAKRAVC
ncbi:hypothetical protein FIBSPDRAFT_892255 [Athelia psychrophila]|uniref:Uncharacterized protein n=1 Tax=Athelia psychrophila TaxID=1759441 RepID=A0A166IR55_9AGAM|nr:hypothetical protein FIBSPDRAFT_892255 [Fibularhizoctonia sp. CBS 109695]